MQRRSRSSSYWETGGSPKNGCPSRYNRSAVIRSPKPPPHPNSGQARIRCVRAIRCTPSCRDYTPGDPGEILEYRTLPPGQGIIGCLLSTPPYSASLGAEVTWNVPPETKGQTCKCSSRNSHFVLGLSLCIEPTAAWKWPSYAIEILLCRGARARNHEREISLNSAGAASAKPRYRRACCLVFRVRQEEKY